MRMIYSTSQVLVKASIINKMMNTVLLSLVVDGIHIEFHTHKPELAITTLSHVWGYSIADSPCPFSKTCPICVLLTKENCERGGERRGKTGVGKERLFFQAK